MCCASFAHLSTYPATISRRPLVTGLRNERFVTWSTGSPSQPLQPQAAACQPRDSGVNLGLLAGVTCCTRHSHVSRVCRVRRDLRSKILVFEIRPFEHFRDLLRGRPFAIFSESRCCAIDNRARGQRGGASTREHFAQLGSARLEVRARSRGENSAKVVVELEGRVDCALDCHSSDVACGRKKKKKSRRHFSAET